MDQAVVMNSEQAMSKIAEQVKSYSLEELKIIKETVAKGASDLELAYFANVSKRYGLDPFLKQIWFYKDTKGNIIILAGRDGFLSLAQKDPRWNGITSDIVRKDEFFSMDASNGKTEHHKVVTSKEPILGAYAICRPKGVEITTIEWADFEVYNKNYNVWKSDPAAMIKKVAETHALKKAYGISGLQSEYDFDTTNGKAITIDHESKPDSKSIMLADELIRTCTGDEDYKQIMEDKIKDPELTNMELENITRELQMNQPKQFNK